ncbi:protein downstream neighbor of son homolog isoform X2 [Scleropages formosus]|uniref:protein downstream neighbor of son homolog isoform X2 n=1 Tax=Scleropages formosus TaxID=113540 RepID=UPI0010FA734C|nr:protein downstream neighbor of Son isoform X2 [Scleropages formosus]
MSQSDSHSYSPSFKRPADTLRSRRKRTRGGAEGSESSGGSSSPSSVSVTVSLPGLRTSSSSSSCPAAPPRVEPGRSSSAGGLKRRNPFASIGNTVSPKRRVADDDGAGDESPCGERRGSGGAQSGKVSELLDRQAAAAETASCAAELDSLLPSASMAEGDATVTVRFEEPASGAGAPLAASADFPPDWSLRTRLLITSPLSFSWAGHLRAQEEAQGVAQHCRGAHTPLGEHIQSLCYWQHPSLPWVPLFPRLGADRSFVGKSAPWGQDEVLQQSLMGEWSLSVTSLYSLVRAHLCPFFYLCSYQFTVLFRATGVSGTRAISAVLSPTTRGLREALRAEGIEFTLPLLERRRKSRELRRTGRLEEEEVRSEGGEEPRAGAEGCDEEEDDEDDTFSWLEEMGVQDKIKRPDSIAVKLHKEHSEVRVDRRPESALLVQGSGTFTLLNFLINCKGLVAAAGPQAGLPPTLLAPVAFRGATLHTLKARSIRAKTRVRSGYTDVCSLEVTGPVMPHALHSLTRLLRSAQGGRFSVGLYPHEATAVFNTSVSLPATGRDQDETEDLRHLGASGLLPSTIEHLAEPPSLGKAALRHLHMDDSVCTWST